MAVDINWSLMQPAPNVGEQFGNAFRQSASESAMGDLGRDPNDQNALNRLMQFNPQAGFAMQDRQQQRAMQQAQLAAQQAEQRRQQQGEARDVAERFTGFAQRVRSLPPEQRASVIAQNRDNLIAMGVPQEMIASFDPSDANLDTLISNGMSAMQHAQMDSQGGYEIDGIRYNRFNQPVQESPYPRIIPGPDGQFNIQPRIGLEGLRGGAAAPPSSQGAPQAPASIPPLPEGATPQGLRAMAAEAIQSGADPALVLPALSEHLRQLEGGAAPSNGQSGFQSNEFYIDPNYWQPTDSRR